MNNSKLVSESPKKKLLSAKENCNRLSTSGTRRKRKRLTNHFQKDSPQQYSYNSSGKGCTTCFKWLHEECTQSKVFLCDFLHAGKPVAIVINYVITTVIFSAIFKGCANNKFVFNFINFTTLKLMFVNEVSHTIVRFRFSLSSAFAKTFGDLVRNFKK